MLISEKIKQEHTLLKGIGSITLWLFYGVLFAATLMVMFWFD